MQAWWLEILYILSGHAAWSHFLASQLALLLTFWAVWRMGQRILGASYALLGVMLLEGVVYYNFTSPEFNPNVLQMPTWALICFFAHRAIREGLMKDWVLLGVVSAAGFYSKYSTVLLLAAIFLFALARPESRRRLRTAGPYVSAVVALVIFLPHILWLFQYDFIPFNYARERLQPPSDGSILHSVLLVPLLFVGSQLLAVLPAFFLAIALLGRSQGDETAMNRFDRQYLAVITFGPCFLLLMVSILTGLQIHDMWAMPFWNFLGLWVLSTMRPELSREAVQRFALTFAVIVVLITMGYVGSTYFYPYASGKGLRIHFPGNALAEAVSRHWEDRFHQPLRYVVGDTWPAGNIAYFSRNRPHVFIVANNKFSPWIDRDDLDKNGGVIVWCISKCSFGNREESMPDYVNRYPTAEVQAPLVLEKMTGAEIKPVKIGWAIIPPRI